MHGGVDITVHRSRCEISTDSEENLSRSIVFEYYRKSIFALRNVIVTTFFLVSCSTIHTEQSGMTSTWLVDVASSKDSIYVITKSELVGSTEVSKIGFDAVRLVSKSGQFHLEILPIRRLKDDGDALKRCLSEFDEGEFEVEFNKLANYVGEYLGDLTVRFTIIAVPSSVKLKLREKSAVEGFIPIP